MNLLSLSFSSTRLMIKYTFSLASNTEFTKISLGSFQNVSENSFVNPSLPGDVSFCILFRELYKHFLVKSSLQSFAGFSESFIGISTSLKKVFRYRVLKNVS